MQMTCLIAETEEELMVKIKHWNEGMESKGLRVNTGKTKAMCCKVRSGQVENSGKWPCGVWSMSEMSGSKLNSLYWVQEMDAQEMQWTDRQFKYSCWF